MLKKLLVASACLMAFATGAYAEKMTKLPVNLEIYGDLEAYYKSQTSYKTPLDSADQNENLGNSWSSGSDVRDGANNRASQTVRAKGGLTMVARAGENDYNGKPWYNLIGVMRLTMDPNDPDYESEENKDGSASDNIGIGDVWIRYSPAVMVGVKIGTQTIAATANMYGIGYSFVGDIDGDFVYWTAAVADQKPGISVDVHLGEGIELGAAMLQGTGDFSQIVSGAKSEQSNNTVIWADLKLGFLDIVFGSQTIASGGTTDASSDSDSVYISKEWKHEESHSLMNFMVKVNIGSFSPFIAYQAASGNKTSATDTTNIVAYNTNVTNFNATLNALTGATAGTITVPSDSLDINLTTTTLGLVADIGPGKLAFEYTQISTPDFGEDGSSTVGIEADNTMHLNYALPITDNGTLTVFYNAFNAKESSNLRASIATLKSNESKYAQNAAFSALESGSATMRANYELMTTTSTSSVGIAFNMKFGN